MLHPFAECVGIELLPELYNLSLQVKRIYDDKQLGVPISFQLGDIFQLDWTDAGVVLVNSTCFYTEMLEWISNTRVQPGCIAISLTRQLSSLSWELLQTSKHKMSWGMSTIHVQRKISEEEQQRRSKEVGQWLGA